MDNNENPDHVLVVDDDADIRDLLAEYLGQNGIKVTVARDAKEMRQVLDGTKPDIIVLDVMMPGEDGLTLCRELRSRSNVPVIMLTARAEEVDRIIGIEMGADDYMGKPFSPRELLARIKGVLRRTRSLPPDARRRAAGQVRRLDPRFRRPPPGRPRRRDRLAQRRRVPVAGGAGRASESRARPQPADGPDAGARGDAFRSQHRRADQPPAQPAQR